MSDSPSTAIVNVGDLVKPVETLINRLSDGAAAVLEPWQMVRRARAEAQATDIIEVGRAETEAKVRLIEEESQLQIAGVRQRAAQRFILEEVFKQGNIESICEKAAPNVEDGSSKAKIEDEWAFHFFDKCKMVSDEEMQTLWAKLLAGEANSPGRYSKRTLTVLSSLEKSDAEQFANVCAFIWKVLGRSSPVIFETSDAICKAHGITFDGLMHLDDIGLVNFSSLAGFAVVSERPAEIPASVEIPFVASYRSKLYALTRSDGKLTLETGKITLTHAGQELSLLIVSQGIDEMATYVLEKWKLQGWNVKNLEGSDQ